MTMMDLDTDILELLDFEYEEPCFNNDLEECDRPAVFKCSLNCCGHIIFYCLECLAYARLFMKMNRGQRFICVFCSASVVIDGDHVKVISRIKE